MYKTCRNNMIEFYFNCVKPNTLGSVKRFFLIIGGGGVRKILFTDPRVLVRLKALHKFCALSKGLA